MTRTIIYLVLFYNSHYDCPTGKKTNKETILLFISSCFCSSVFPAMKRFGLGFLFLAIYTIFAPYYQDSYYLTDEFEVRVKTDISKHFYLKISHRKKPFPLCRLSLSGIAVFLFSSGEKSCCINTSAVGL